MSIVYLSKERNEHLVHASPRSPLRSQASRENDRDTFCHCQEIFEPLPSSVYPIEASDTPISRSLNRNNHSDTHSPLYDHNCSTVSQHSSIDGSTHDTNEKLYKLVRALDMRGMYEPNWTYVWSCFMGIIGFCDYLCWIGREEKRPTPQQNRKRNRFLEMILFWKTHVQQRNLKAALPKQHGFLFYPFPYFLKVMNLCRQGFTSRQVIFTWIFSIVWFIEALRVGFRTYHRMKSEYLLGLTLLRRDGKLISTTLFDIELHLPFLAAIFSFFMYLSMVQVEFFFLNWKDVESMLSLRPNIQPYFDAISYHYSILYVLYLDVISGFLRTLAEAKSAYLFTLYRKLTINTVNLAVRDPPSLKKRIYFLLRLIRWAKYLAPLIGTANMLLDSAVDLMKKWKQFREARITQKIVNQYWKVLTVQGKQDHAAIVIQRMYRSYHSKLLHEKRQSESMQMAAAKRIQKAMRHKLRRTRKRLDTNMEQLELIKTHRSKNIPVEHLIQLKELKYDLNRTCDAKISRRMLLRPNTKFSVAWKILFVISVSIEISFLSLKPYIERRFFSPTHEPITIENAIATIFIPNDLYSSPLCQLNNGQSDDKKKKKKQMASPFKNFPKETLPEKPWFCHEPWPVLHRVYIRFMSLIIHQADILISAICFCDVFITFFIGEIDEATGVLKPKSFFTRWIFPGLLLQLLVNPKMADVAMSVKYLGIHIYRIGPTRVIRWGVAFILPIYWHFTSWAFWNLWMRFVCQQNLHHL